MCIQWIFELHKNRKPTIRRKCSYSLFFCVTKNKQPTLELNFDLNIRGSLVAEIELGIALPHCLVKRLTIWQEWFLVILVAKSSFAELLLPCTFVIQYISSLKFFLYFAMWYVFIQHTCRLYWVAFGNTIQY